MAQQENGPSGEVHDATGSARLAEITRRLDVVRARVSAACQAADRDERDVHLVAVTKFFPAGDVAHLLRLGVRDIGESRDQEAIPKLAEIADVGGLAAAADRRVHFIGQVQTNKARSIARYADVVHSVDRVKLVNALDRAVGAATTQGERTTYLGALIQLDLEEGDRAGRGGVAPGRALLLAEQVAAAQHLELRGVMAVAPPGLDDTGLRVAFARVADCARAIRAGHPGATWSSIGMSADLEHAIEAGATHLRVGSAILGSRAPRR